MTYYEMTTTLPGTLPEIKERVTAALKAQGFGILTEIDAQKIFKEKLNVDFKPYLILGACNPVLSHRALTADESIGLLLPCNVVLKQVEDHVVVSIIDPEAMFSVVEQETKEKLGELPLEAKARLQAALSSLMA